MFKIRYRNGRDHESDTKETDWIDSSALDAASEFHLRKPVGADRDAEFR
jgi:hypothetical protein